IWDWERGAVATRLDGTLGNAVAFLPDGRLASGYFFEGLVRVWDTRAGKHLTGFKGEMTWVRSVAVRPGGGQLGPGRVGGANTCGTQPGADNSIRVWDIAEGREVHCLRGHEHVVFSVAYSPDGRWLLSGSFDKTVRLWDAASGRELCRLEGHTGHIWGVSF